MARLVLASFFAAILCMPAGGSLAGPITLESTQPIIDWPVAPGCDHPMPPELSFALFDFDPSKSLATLTGIEFTMTMQNAETAVGEAFHDKLSLGLGGVDTGLKLNGFGMGQEPTLTFQLHQGDPGWLSSSAVNELLSQVNGSHSLLASILNTGGDTCCLNLYSAFDTTLRLIGDPAGGTTVPEPGTLAIWGLALAWIGWRARGGRRAARS